MEGDLDNLMEEMDCEAQGWEYVAPEKTKVTVKTKQAEKQKVVVKS
mgnify:CR=1 FL=1